MLKTKQKESLTETREVLSKIYKKYRDNPVFFVEHCLGHKTWSKQREILLSVASNPYTVVRASHSVSKTFTAAEIVCWFFNSYPNSKVITTAPTWRQVRDLLWSEIGKNYRTTRYKLEGDCQVTAVRSNRTEHYVEGFSSDKSVSVEGWHAPEILFVLDEAKGIPQWVWDSLKGSMTGGFCRCLVISTTDGIKPGEYYHRIFTDPQVGKKWNKIHIAAKDNPYVTGEKFRSISISDLNRPDKFEFTYTDPGDFNIQMATPTWMKECADEWGKDSVLYITKVEGEICDKGLDSIIHLGDVLKMFDNHREESISDEGQIEIGADIARFGEDTTVFYKRKGMKVIGRREFSKQDTKKTSDKLMEFSGTDKNIRIKVDDTGLGGGVTDNLTAAGYNVIPINFQNVAMDQNKYPNTISEMWYEVAPLIPEISAPHSDRLQTELVNRQSKGLDKKGRRCIESKKDYKKRGFRSPDDADAFLLCFYTGQVELRIR